MLIIVKKYFLLFLALFFINAGFGQKTTGEFYIYKKDGTEAADVKEAAYLIHIFKLNDTVFLSRYYNFAGSMIRQESYKDSGLTIPNGRFCWYNSKGELDSTGTVTNGKKDGSWQYITSPSETYSVKYDLGKKIEEHTYHYDKNGKYINNDTSLAAAEEDLMDYAKNYSIKSKQVKANFKKGVNDWVSYCQKNLHTPERLQNTLQDGVHTCTVSFIIDTLGNTGDIYLTQSCEWSGDAEVMRLIADSPRWQPAMQNDKLVIYRQKQSLSYQVVSR